MAPFDEQRVTMIITHTMSMVNDVRLQNATAKTTMYLAGAYEQFVCVDYECQRYGQSGVETTYHQLVYEFPVKPVNARETVPLPKVSIDDQDTQASPLFTVNYHTMPHSFVRESTKEAQEVNRIKYAHQQPPTGNVDGASYYQEFLPETNLCKEASIELGSGNNIETASTLSPYCRKLCDRSGHALIQWRNHTHAYYDSYGVLEEYYTTYVWSGFTLNNNQKVVAFIELMQEEDIDAKPKKQFELRRDHAQFPQLRMFYIR